MTLCLCLFTLESQEQTAIDLLLYKCHLQLYKTITLQILVVSLLCRFRTFALADNLEATKSFDYLCLTLIDLALIHST